MTDEKDDGSLAREYSPLRENRSAAKRSESNGDLVGKEKTKTSRTKSIQDMLVEKASQAKVSFSSVSIMVDAVMRLSANHVTDKVKLEVEAAVENNNIEEIKELISSGSTDLQTALVSALERDNVRILTELLAGLENINKHFQPSGLSLLSIAVASEALECVKVLLKAGADPNQWDLSNKMTAMHTVAQTGLREDRPVHTSQLLELLVQHGGNINIGIEKNGGSVLHCGVRQRNYSMVTYLLDHKVETVCKTFHETALHIAVEQDDSSMAELLLEANRGCVNSLMDDTRRLSPLHLVAEAGHSETCKVLLNFGADVSLLTGNKRTALHLAAKNLNLEVLKQLLEVTVRQDTNLINARDKSGKTALSVCSSSPLKSSQGAIDCMIALINLKADLDSQDDMGNTPLHNAATDKKASRVKLLIRYGADLSIKNNAGFSALFFINKHVPQCFKAFEERLDSGLMLEGSSELNSYTGVKLDFHKLSPNINSTDTRQRQDIAIFIELMKSPHSHLLKHPLSEAFLHLKWKQIQYMHVAFIIFTHFVYSLVYTIYALSVFVNLCRPDTYEDIIDIRWDIASNITCKYHPSEEISEDEYKKKAVIAQVSWVFLIMFTLMYVVNESIKIFTNMKDYFSKWDSYIDLILIFSFPLISFHQDPFVEVFSMKLWQFHMAAAGSFLSWLQMMFLIGKLPKFGKYVQMFRTVAYGVLNFLFAYVFLLIAFAVSFMIVFPQSEAFQIVPTAFVKLVVMMLGEVDYEALYYPDHAILQTNNITNRTEIVTETEGQVLPGTAQLLVFLFIFLVSIILMNLLVGLAVSDIQGLSKSAKLEQLLQQVELINIMESWLHSPIFFVLPEMLKMFLRHKLQGLDGRYNRYNLTFTVKLHDLNDKRFSESLKKSLYDNCRRREMREREAARDAAMKQMQSEMHQLVGMLLGKSGPPDYHRSASKLSVLSNSVVSTQFQVEDDYESDVEDISEDQGSRSRLSRLASIMTEAGRFTSRRRVSNNSILTTADIENDYSGFINYDKFDSIEEK